MTDGVAGLLEVDSVSKRFGGVQAVSGLSLTLAAGEILGLIGPNGAGKTTAFHLISGFVRPDSGDIRFGGRSVVGMPPHAICARGLCRTFQVVRPFGQLTVLENVEVGALTRHPRRTEARARARAVVERLGLGPARDAPASALPLAQRKRLELARALATEPSLILLDEVMAGLTVPETAAMVDLVTTLNRDGLSVLLIEHNLRAVMALSHRLVVLSFGQVLAEGAPARVAREPRVVEAYLGDEAGEGGIGAAGSTGRPGGGPVIAPGGAS